MVTLVDDPGFSLVSDERMPSFTIMPGDGRPSPFNVPANVVEAVMSGAARIGEGYRTSTDASDPSLAGTLRMQTGVPQMALGAVEIALSPLTAASRVFGGAVEAATGGMITEQQAETALLGIGARGGIRPRVPSERRDFRLAPEDRAAVPAETPKVAESAPAATPSALDAAQVEHVGANGMRGFVSTPERDILRVQSLKDLQAKAPNATEPIVKETLSRDVNNAVLDLLEAGKVRLAPDIKISDQMLDLMQTNIIPAETFNAILAKHNITAIRLAEELAAPMRASATQSARTLQSLSELRKAEMRMRALSGEQSEEVAAFLKQHADDVLGTNTASYIQRVGNVWRGALVSQLATAMRNTASQVATVGVDTMTRGLEQGLRTLFGNPIRRILGKEPITDPIDVLGNMISLFGPIRAKEITDAVMAVKPSVRESLFSRYMSDVSRATGGGGLLGKVESAVDALNIVNRSQEFFFRRAIFSASLDRRLKGVGKSIDEIVASNRLGEIPDDILKASITDALELTYARPMKGDLLGEVMSGLEKVLTIGGKVPFSPMPFMRFMTEALRFQYQYSPLGATRLLAPKEMGALLSGETAQMKVAAKALVGSSMLYGAYLMRNSEYAGPRWYEMKTADGRMIDARPLAPFSAYLFVGDLIKRFQDGTLLGMDAKDLAQGLVGVNFRAGAGLFVVDKLFDELAGVDSSKKLLDVVKSYTGNILSGFATPFQMLKDVVGHFDPQERVVRDTRTDPLLGPTRRRIPYADASLPPTESPTRTAPPERLNPLMRQLTGVTDLEKPNPAEAELNRLGFSRREILPPSGDKEFDVTIAKHLGPLVESAISAIVQSTGYQQLESNKVKAELLREALPLLRKAATAQAQIDNAAGDLRRRYNRLPERQRAVIEEALRNRGTPLQLPR